MDTIYKIKGLMALCLSKMSRYSGNGIRGHWLIIFIAISLIFLQIIILCNLSFFFIADKFYSTQIPMDDKLNELFYFGKNPLPYIFITIVFAVATKMILSVIKNKFVIFKTKRNLNNNCIVFNRMENTDYKVAAKFYFYDNDCKNDDYFSFVNSRLNEMDNKDVFVAHVDASSYFMGLKVSNKKGIWIVPIKPNSVSNVKHGIVYYGLKQYPALQFNYHDMVNPAEVRLLTILFENDIERETLLS